MTDERPRILVGVDGSADGLRAVMYAMREARVSGGDLTLVNSVDDAVLAGAWGVMYDPDVLTDVGEAAIQEARDLLADEGFEADRVSSTVLMGNPAAVLARLSADADLLVVGRRAVGGLERMFVGSTSVTLAATAKCRMITISAASNPEQTGGRGVVAVGTEDVGQSARALEWGFHEARVRKAVLRVVHVVAPEPRGLLDTLEDPDLHRKERVLRSTEELERVLLPLRESHPGVEVELDVSYGIAVSELVARTAEVDLLILGVRPTALAGLALGGVVRGVMAHAQCPVGTVL